MGSALAGRSLAVSQEWNQPQEARLKTRYRGGGQENRARRRGVQSCLHSGLVCVIVCRNGGHTHSQPLCIGKSQKCGSPLRLISNRRRSNGFGQRRIR